MQIIKKISSVIIILFMAGTLFSQTTFSGYSGGKLLYSANEEQTDKYDPDAKLQAFFQGQFNFSQNTWGHLEFTIDTNDFLNEELFHSTDAKFKINEISMIFKSQIETSSNYFSIFMGTYDPIGSDIFLQRYFGIKPISSKITESWLGLSGSILYPQFGIGIADVKRFSNSPTAIGGYLYINHEDNKYYVLNADARFACVYRYFTFDFAGGIGAPLADNNQGSDVIASVEKIYWHAGTTMLIGNNYTQGLFIQAGLYNVPFTKKNGTQISANDIYILFEPRFLIDNAHFNFSIYSLPKDTANQLPVVDGTLGINANIYGDSLSWGSKRFKIGTNFAFSFNDKTFMDLINPLELIKSNYNISMTPYISTNLLNGDIHAQASINFMKFVNAQWYNALTCDIGYSVRF